MFTSREFNFWEFENWTPQGTVTTVKILNLFHMYFAILPVGGFLIVNIFVKSLTARDHDKHDLKPLTHVDWVRSQHIYLCHTVTVTSCKLETHQISKFD